MTNDVAWERHGLPAEQDDVDLRLAGSSGSAPEVAFLRSGRQEDELSIPADPPPEWYVPPDTDG